MRMFVTATKSELEDKWSLTVLKYVITYPTHSKKILPTLHSLNRASWYIYVKKTNKMNHYLINLFLLNYLLRVSKKQVDHKEVMSVLATCIISHASMGCPAVNTIWLELMLVFIT